MSSYQTWRKPLLKEQTTYAYLNSQYIPLKVDEYNYQGGFSEFTGFKVRPCVTADLYNTTIMAYYQHVPSFFETGFYKVQVGKDLLVEKKETAYSGQKTTVARTTYSYNDFDQLVKENTYTSTGDALQTIKRFPYDMVTQNLDPTGIYKLMVNSNFLDEQIQNVQSKNDKQLAVTKTNYYQPYTNLFLPQTVERQQGSSPIETRIAYSGYDSQGNVLTVSKAGGPSLGYHWGYQNTFPIAECKNASDKEFYYEGYEESTASDVQTNLLSAHTGMKYATATSINWARPNSRSYVISYWYRVGTEWKYTGELPYAANTYTMTGGNAYDDVRIYPQDAQMTTFTYEPLVGMTSQTDANGQTSYYEYDDYQRLYRVRDQDRRIVKQYCYNYAGQQTDCAVPVNPSASQPTQPTPGVIYARVETSACSTDASTGAQTCSFQIKLYADQACNTPAALGAPMTFSFNEVKRVSSTANPNGTVTITRRTATGAIGDNKISIGRYVLVDCPAVPPGGLNKTAAGSTMQSSVSPQVVPGGGGSTTCTTREINLNTDGNYTVVTY